MVSLDVLSVSSEFGTSHIQNWRHCRFFCVWVVASSDATSDDSEVKTVDGMIWPMTGIYREGHLMSILFCSQE